MLCDWPCEFIFLVIIFLEHLFCGVALNFGVAIFGVEVPLLLGDFFYESYLRAFGGTGINSVCGC